MSLQMPFERGPQTACPSLPVTLRAAGQCSQLLLQPGWYHYPLRHPRLGAVEKRSVAVKLYSDGLRLGYPCELKELCARLVPSQPLQPESSCVLQQRCALLQAHSFLHANHLRSPRCQSGSSFEAARTALSDP